MVGSQGFPLVQLVIDEATWASAKEHRRAEWELALAELAEASLLGLPPEPPPSPYRGRVTLAPDRLVLEVHGGDGRLAGRAELSLEHLGPPMAEYVAICRQMSCAKAGSHSPHLEALDIAKRLCHDEAAELIVALCAPLEPDLPTARRLFTLAVTLCYDTTQLALPHRR